MKKLITLLVLFCLTGCGGCDNCDEATTTVDTGWSGGLFNVWIPQHPRAVMILHQGHNCFDDCYGGADDNLVPVAERLRDAGFIVYGFEMPVFPHSSGPIEYYYENVLNFVNSLNDCYPVYMMGLSGGGWTTTVITALSDKILYGYSIAGDAPFDIRDRSNQPPDLEWEQLNPPTGSYRELYRIAENRLLHIYNYNESHVVGEGYTGSVLACEANSECVMGYPYIWDYEAQGHQISSWATDYIIKDILGE